MKLNYKRTIFVGFAFFLICTFWQAYDTIIPKILTDKFGMNQANSGIIMALDNILALFMLPLFGALSDRCKSKRGRRTPFIVIGTLCAAVLLVGLSFTDNAQLKNISDVSKIDLLGDQQEIVSFEMSRAKMANLGITPEMVQRVVEGQNAAADAGKVRVDDKYVRIFPSGSVGSVQDFERLVISVPKGDGSFSTVVR